MATPAEMAKLTAAHLDDIREAVAASADNTNAEAVTHYISKTPMKNPKYIVKMDGEKHTCNTYAEIAALTGLSNMQIFGKLHNKKKRDISIKKIIYE